MSWYYLEQTECYEHLPQLKYSLFFKHAVISTAHLITLFLKKINHVTGKNAVWAGFFCLPILQTVTQYSLLITRETYSVNVDCYIFHEMTV